MRFFAANGTFCAVCPAFFVAVCLVLCIFDAARKAALCILLGAAVGMASVLHTANRLERIRVQYAGRPLVLTAEVESTADSYDPGIVDAVLHVEKVNGSAASFRVECSALPECKAGERVQGRFILSAPASGSRVSLYADGIALQAEMDEDGPELTVLGESGSFRARTHRLQQRLSASLRRRMDGKTRRCAGCHDYRRPELSVFGHAQRLPGRGSCPCAGGKRNACVHFVR